MLKRTSKKSTKKSTDISLTATSIVEEATKEPIKEKNPAAVALGRLGGLKGGIARAKKLTPEQRSKIARKAAQIRWQRATENANE